MDAAWWISSMVNTIGHKVRSLIFEVNAQHNFCWSRTTKTNAFKNFTMALFAHSSSFHMRTIYAFYIQMCVMSMPFCFTRRRRHCLKIAKWKNMKDARKKMNSTRWDDTLMLGIKDKRRKANAFVDVYSAISYRSAYAKTLLTAGYPIEISWNNHSENCVN